MAETTNNNPSEAIAVTVVEPKNNGAKEEHTQKQKKTPLKSFQFKHIVLPLALFTFIFSLPLLFQAIWLIYIQQTDCEELLKSLPRLQLGIAVGLVFLFFVSNVVVHSRARFAAPGLIVVMLPLVVTFIVGLSLSGNFEMETRRLPASPTWLKMKIHNVNDWNDIKSCVYDAMICRDLISRSYDLKSYDFTTSKMTPLESGCCKPPPACEMEYMNATYWTKSTGGERDTDMPYDKDCDLWKNDETRLCYDCHACKEGFVNTLEGKWLELGTFLVVMSVLLMTSHLLLFVATMWEQKGG